MFSNLVRSVRRVTQPLTATPLRDIESTGRGQWHVTGETGIFELHGTRSALPSGWTALEFKLEDRTVLSRPPTLIVDEGAGFFQSSGIALPLPRAGWIRTMLRLPPAVAGLRLELSRGDTVEFGNLAAREIGTAEALLRLASPVVRRRLKEPWDLLHSARKLIRTLRDGGPRAVLERLLQKSQHEAPQLGYVEWRRRFAALSEFDRVAIRDAIAEFRNPPRFSVVMPVHNTPERWLRRAIASVRAQLYGKWELCIADDASKDARVREVLQEAAREDDRIKVVFRPSNGHISAASNSALELASGEFVVLLDHDDELAEHALFVLAAELSDHPETDLVYSDEDKIDERGLFYQPFFKPDWNPDLFLSQNYLAHLCALRMSLVRQVGGFRAGFEGSQDYDLFLRVVALSDGSRIRHVPYVLYHWRAIDGSTALVTGAKSYAESAARKALEQHLAATVPDASVEAGRLPTTYRVRFRLPDPAPKASLVIPTRDARKLIEKCIESLLSITRYPDIEIIVVDNQSRERSTLRYLAALQQRGVARVLRFDQPFNFSAINNFAVKEAAGEIVGLLNNDLEIIEPDWLREMVSHAIRPGIGAVGARLLYADGTLQHGGVILGIGGIAGHAHKYLPAQAPGYFSRAHLIHDVSAVTGACLIVRRKNYLDAGGFDETLPVAFNDVDFCMRLRNRGLRNLWTPYATLVHHESKTRGLENTPAKRARFRREMGEMQARWGDILSSDPAYNPNLTLDTENFALAWPPRVTPPWRRGMVDAAGQLVGQRPPVKMEGAAT